MNNKDIKQLLDKYWIGETSLQEEFYLKKHAKESSANNDDDIDMSILSLLSSQGEETMPSTYNTDHWNRIAKELPTNKTKVFSLYRWVAAASLIFILGIGTFMVQQQWSSDNYGTVASTEEAIEESEKALLFLAEHFSKGQKATKEIIHLQTLGNTLQ